MTQKHRDDEERAARLGMTIPASSRHAEVSAPEWKPTPTRGGKEAVGLVSRARWFCPECTAANERRAKRNQLLIEFCRHRVHLDDRGQHPLAADEIALAAAMVEMALAREDATLKVVIGEPSDADRLHWAFIQAGLSSREAEVWDLHCYGLSPREISERVEQEDGEPLSRQAVGTYIARGRQKLRKWTTSP